MLNLRLILLFFIITVASATLSAQQDIALSDVLKVDVIKAPGGFFGDPQGYHKYEITNENGIWVSNKMLWPSGKTFFSNVSTEKINQLLSFMSATDTTIHIEQFKLNKADMELAFDSLNRKDSMEITQKQRALFLKRFSKVQSDSLTRRLLYPEGYSDRAGYFIRVTTKDGNMKTIQALSGNFYDLPWKVAGKPIYNPEISRLFAELTGDKEYDKYAKTHLYHVLMRFLYWKEFMTGFTIENFKRDYPIDYKKLGNRLRITDASKSNRGWYFSLTSSKLPSQVTIGVGRFKRPDTILTAIKLLEERLIRLRQSNNYIFKYLKNNSKQLANAHVREFHYDDDNDYWILKRIKPLYSPLASITPQQVTVIDIYSKGVGRHKGDTMWLLLPDDSIISVPYESSFWPGSSGNTAYIYDKNGLLLKKLTFN
ncbi:hypothetical protein ACVWYN_003366 [Pedobacter sp. UYP24]